MTVGEAAQTDRPPAGTPGRTPLVHITTVPMSLTFLRGQIGFMQARGFDVHVLSSPDKLLTTIAADERVVPHAIPMARRITPLRDLRTVARVWRLLRRLRPAIVHAHTPKGGLLGMIGAWLARTPVRVYHMRGLPFMTATGRRRRLLRTTEWISCRLAQRVICVSQSLRDVAITEGLCSPEKIVVLGGGSGNGVDAMGRFHPAKGAGPDRAAMRARLGIPATALVVGFVGRLVRDKGIVELSDAWQHVRAQVPAAHLLLVGPFEPQDPVPSATVAALHQDPRVHLAGAADDAAPAYRAMDLVVLPTYREGFPNVPLEAAAMELPVVATRIPGCVDAVQAGVTGTLVPPYDAVALADAIERYLGEPALRRDHGRAGRARVLRDFRPEAIWAALYEEYAHLLTKAGIAPPEPALAASALRTGTGHGDV